MADESTGKSAENARLEDIPTQWSLLRLAHESTVTTAGPARNALVLRYANAIGRYVAALVHDPNDADEVAQEVIVRLLRGQFAAASPERGRFRHLLMVATRNLVRTYWTRKERRAGVAADLAAIPADTAPQDEAAVDAWRQSILELAWQMLERHERSQAGSVAWTLLRLRAEHPDDDAEQLAVRLAQKTGRPFRADAVRQQLRRARVRFAQALLEEVARGLDEPTPERVQEELIDLGLMDYVRDFLPDDWRSRGELNEEA